MLARPISRTASPLHLLVNKDLRAERMVDENTSSSLLERPIEHWLRMGDTQAIKKALVENGLLEGFADYLINVFANNERFTDSAAAAHDLVELVREFKKQR